MKLKQLFLAAAVVFAGLLSLRAQPVNVQQFQNIQQLRQSQQPLAGATTVTNAPELYPSENEDVGPQHILRLNPRPKYFDLLLDSQVFFTDNANFAQGAAVIGSAVFVNTVQASFMPADLKIGPGKLSPAAGFISQWYNYENNQLKSLDFNAQTAFVSARYSINNWQFGAGGNYTRLLDQASYNQTYQEWLPALSLQRLFPVGKKLLFALGNQADYRFTTVPATTGTAPDSNDRFDDTVSLTANWQITPHLAFQPYARFQYSYYIHNTLQNSDRNDYLSSAGLTLTYYFNQNLSLRGFYNANLKQSSDAFTPAYQEMNEGLGVALNFKF